MKATIIAIAILFRLAIYGVIGFVALHFLSKVW